MSIMHADPRYAELLRERLRLRNDESRLRILRHQVMVELTDAALLLGVSVRTVNRWSKDKRKQFPTVQLDYRGRRMVVVDALLEWARMQIQKTRLINP
jgi:hypothetical protein